MQIKIKSDSLPQSFTSTGLRFADSSVVDADVVVFCTGFNSNMRTRIVPIVGQDVADRLDDTTGFDAEGELRSNWRQLGRKCQVLPQSYRIGSCANNCRSGDMVCLRFDADIALVFEVSRSADQG